MKLNHELSVIVKGCEACWQQSVTWEIYFKLVGFPRLIIGLAIAEVICFFLALMQSVWSGSVQAN